MIYSAHWDHFGTRDPQPGDKPDADRIFNGAYDNASGCAGVLEIAKAFAKAPQKPARSIYFAFVTAEESGLLGSAFLAANPPLPIDKVAANINIDGVNYLGPTKDMVQLGSERSTLGPMVEALLKERGRTLTGDTHPERGYFFRSDHFPFAKVGVPAMSLSEPKQFTGPNAAELLKKQEAYNGTDYHQPSDEYDPSWDFTGGVNDMKVLAQLGWRIAQQPETAEIQRRRSVRRGQEEITSDELNDALERDRTSSRSTRSQRARSSRRSVYAAAGGPWPGTQARRTASPQARCV